MMAVSFAILFAFLSIFPSEADVGGTRYKHWADVQGANYVPSYSVNDVKDVFRPGFWDAKVIDRELGYAKTLAVNSLRVFVSHGAFLSGNSSYQEVFLQNYLSFQHLAKAHGLTLMITLGTGERSYGPCNQTTSFVQAIVGQELPGTVIAYEADNEPTSYVIPYVLNCTLPALHAASKNPEVDISVGLAHVGEVHAVRNMVTTLNWHSYNGQKNGAGLYGEILELNKYVNKFHPPKQLVLTEWLARPAQPVAAAYPVLRDNGVAAYNWALIIVDCTSHWNRPIVPGDPPFQGMLWPNGSAFDDVEEGECMRTKCSTVKYIHHCCNNWHANGSALNRLWTFSTHGTSNLSHWQTKVFGDPTYRLPGPREGSMRWTNQSGASFTLGPLPPNTRRVALYLPKSPEGARFTITLDGQHASTGSTVSQQKEWLFRTIVPVTGERVLKLIVGETTNTTKFSVSGATFLSS